MGPGKGKSVAEMEAIAQFLFQLLDDIDTCEDIAKGNDETFRRLVTPLHQRRFEVASTDGHKVWWTPEESPGPSSVVEPIPPSNI